MAIKNERGNKIRHNLLDNSLYWSFVVGLLLLEVDFNLK
jgi:hypothetical protein